eukprot:759208-Hanusia_phi.AAC.1
MAVVVMMMARGRRRRQSAYLILLGSSLQSSLRCMRGTFARVRRLGREELSCERGGGGSSGRERAWEDMESNCPHVCSSQLLRSERACT